MAIIAAAVQVLREVDHISQASGQSSTPSPKFGAGIWVFSQFVDRYAADGCSEPVSTTEAIQRAGKVDGIVALDVNYPWPEENLSVKDVGKILSDNGLRATRSRRTSTRATT